MSRFKAAVAQVKLLLELLKMGQALSFQVDTAVVPQVKKSKCLRSLARENK